MTWMVVVGHCWNTIRHPSSLDHHLVVAAARNQDQSGSLGPAIRGGFYESCVRTAPIRRTCTSLTTTTININDNHKDDNDDQQ